MSLLRPPPENFYPGVNLDLAGRPPLPPRRRDLEKFRALAESQKSKSYNEIRRIKVNSWKKISEAHKRTTGIK